MKKMGVILILWFMFVGVLSAQNLSEQTKNISEEQVPMAVRQSFHKSIGEASDGYWVVAFTTEQVGSRTVAVPEWYGFIKGRKKDRSEIRFNPQGHVVFAKGFILKTDEDMDKPVGKAEGV